MTDRQPARREFLKAAASAALGAVASNEGARGADEPRPVRVVVWDERQPAQREAYENFLGDRIAEHLRNQPGFQVQSVGIDEPEQGLAPSALDACDVLIWWGHVRHAEITPETGRKIVERINRGDLALVALHSAHWSTPFVEAMYERARQDVDRAFASSRREVVVVQPPQRYTLPKYDSRLTPYSEQRKYPDGRLKLTVHLPYCCFPAYRHDAKPSHVQVLRPEHPIAAGLPREFQVSHTEMYDEPFHVSEPDEVIFEECWENGEWFRSGMVWKVGKGHVFYFRPGHETYPVYQEEAPLKVLTNAARWLASKPG
jgi:trehalose utilization protein